MMKQGRYIAFIMLMVLIFVVLVLIYGSHCIVIYRKFFLAQKGYSGVIKWEIKRTKRKKRLVEMSIEIKSEEEIAYEEAKRIIERDLSWHQWIERKRRLAGISKEDISDFINDAINEKIDKKNKEDEKEWI